MQAVTIKAVGISTAIFLVGLLVIFIITSRFLKPIETLTLAAKRIEEGDLQYRVNIDRDDEIGILAAGFDRMMADRLMQRERELKQSQVTLRRADRLSSLGLLTAGLAHEIRNPLVAIRTFTQLLPERYDDAEFREGFQGLALKEVDRICGLINDLLSFARPSKPNVLPRISTMWSTTSRAFWRLKPRKKTWRLREIRLSLPKVWIDREQMKQVFMNLILNAIQAMKDGGSIIISTRLSARSSAEPSESSCKSRFAILVSAFPKKTCNIFLILFLPARMRGAVWGWRCLTKSCKSTAASSPLKARLAREPRSSSTFRWASQCVRPQPMVGLR